MAGSDFGARKKNLKPDTPGSIFSTTRRQRSTLHSWEGLKNQISHSPGTENSQMPAICKVCRMQLLGLHPMFLSNLLCDIFSVSFIFIYLWRCLLLALISTYYQYLFQLLRAFEKGELKILNYYYYYYKCVR